MSAQEKEERASLDWELGSVRAGRFELIEVLGEGGFGTVYKARDVRTGALVAMKVLRARNTAALLGFKQEFRALASVTHPNLVSLFELHAEGDAWFLTMEYVDGVALLEHVHVDTRPVFASTRERPRPGSAPKRQATTRAVDASRLLAIVPDTMVTMTLRGEETQSLLLHDTDVTVMNPADAVIPAQRAAVRPSPVRDFVELRRVLRDLADALAWLHRAGKLHRDVKPSNILIETGGRVVVLDFGLIQEIGAGFAPAAERAVVIGTPAYMAPEALGDGPIGPESDWYSFGALLYEALTGRHPFGGTVATVLRHKVARDPPAPSDIAEGVPADLDALCYALLARAPADRPDAQAIRDALGGPRARRSLGLGRHARPFVGRAREIEALRGALAAARGGATTVALVEGLSGMGKSMLVERFFAALGPGEAQVLAGRCYERESVPYKALDGVVDALAQRLSALDEKEIANLLPAGAQAIGRLFPALRQIAAAPRAGDAAEPMDAQQLLRAAARALREVLGALARRGAVVLAIDDLQWGDEDSITLLGELLRGPGAPPILLIGTYRSDEAATSPFLRRMLAPDGPAALAEKVVRIALGPLGEADARALAEALGASAAAAVVAREADGCPLFIQELALHTGAPEGRPAMNDAIRARVALLPEPARRYLEMVAVAGHPVSDALLREAADLRDMARKHRQLLEHENLVRTRAGAMGDEVEPWHDRIRESVTLGIAPDRLRAQHLRLAEALEAAGSADPSRLADHYREGGDSARALPHAIAAGERAAEALAFDRAARWYRAAIELSPRAGLDLRVRLAHALRNAGRGAEAAKAYIDAADHAGSGEAHALRILATEQYLFTGEYAAGSAIIRDVLARVRLSPARNVLTSFAEFAWGAVKLKRRGLDADERDAAEVSPEVLQQLDILWSASIGMSMAAPLESQAIQKRHLLLALDTGEPRRLLRALDIELAFSGMPGGRDERVSEDLARRAQALADRLPEARGRAFTLMAGSAVQWLRGRWPEAHAAASRSHDQFRAECTGVTWELDTSQFVALDALAHMGRWREIRAQFPGLLADAKGRGDRFLETQLRTRFDWLAALIEDDPARARRDLDEAIRRWTAEGFHIVHFWELTGQVWIRLYEGDGEGALSAIRERLWKLRLSGLLIGQYYRALFLDLHARATIAAANAAAAGSRERRSALGAAWRDGEKLVREDMPWTIPHGHAVLGCVAAARGDEGEARARWRQAAVGFDAAKMAIHAAAVRARLGRSVGGEEGRALVEGAEAVLRGEEIARPERVVAMLCP